MENWCLDGLHRKRGSHRDGFIRHISTSMPDPPQRASGPLRMGFDSSPCPWEPWIAENSAHFRSAGDTKLDEGCTKLGGDTNLSWELPASTAPAPQKSLLRLAIKRSAASAGHEGVSPPGQGFVWSLWVCNHLLCSRPAVFSGGKEKSNQCKAQSSAELIWHLLWTCLFSNAKRNE